MNDSAITTTAILQKSCTFIDLVPTFRNLAKTTLTSTIQTQSTLLTQILTPRITLLSEALGSSEAVEEWTDAETALTAGLYHLMNLSQAWKGVLSYEVYGRSMGCLVDVLFGLFLDKVMVKDSGGSGISEPACHFVAALFRNAVKGVTELFIPLLDTTTTSSNNNNTFSTTSTPTAPNSPDDNEESTKEFQKFSHLSQRFIAVGKFMDMSLADIGMALSGGIFRSVTGPELSRLIIAVFEDSEKRRGMLALLASESAK